MPNKKKKKLLVFKKISHAVSKPVVKKRRKKKVLEKENLNFKYKGRNSRWLILQLTEDCNILDKYDSIVQELKTTFGDSIDYFIPLYREKINNKPVCLLLFEGYVFVKCTDTIGEWVFKNRTENIMGPLFSGDKCKYVSNKDINKFKNDIQKMIKNKIPEKGQTVIPKEGDYKNLEGKVLSVNKYKMVAVVLFEKRSRIVEAPINIINLDIVE